ncbi:MAG TPA: DUF4345 family protein [Chthonomonadaceae bacterium]|nr:DUF4345 family protein [Chthonomonadaceae bacterium]
MKATYPDAVNASAETTMRASLSPLVLWQSRLVMAAATVVFTGIALKAVLTPIPYAASRGILLNTAQAITDMRAAEGGFPLAVAVFLIYCLISQKRYPLGLLVVALNAGIILLARLIGVALDHSLTENVKLIVPEVVMTLFAVGGLLLRHRGASALKTV